jgi:hypothetical protein
VQNAANGSFEPNLPIYCSAANVWFNETFAAYPFGPRLSLIAVRTYFKNVFLRARVSLGHLREGAK